MWSRDNKVWQEFRKDIMAMDIAEGVFLADYLRYLNVTRTYAAALEIADLQRYKVIKEPAKVKTAIFNRLGIPFTFVIGKN